MQHAVDDEQRRRAPEGRPAATAAGLHDGRRRRPPLGEDGPDGQEELAVAQEDEEELVVEGGQRRRAVGHGAGLRVERADAVPRARAVGVVVVVHHDPRRTAAPPRACSSPSRLATTGSPPCGKAWRAPNPPSSSVTAYQTCPSTSGQRHQSRPRCAVTAGTALDRPWSLAWSRPESDTPCASHSMASKCKLSCSSRPSGLSSDAAGSVY